jgi:transposase InsO family protein
MNIHQCARTTPASRGQIVHRLLHERQGAAEIAAGFGISARTVFKWARRWREEGPAGLQDRRATPRRQPRRLDAEHVWAIERLRRLRFRGPTIARVLGLPVSTVGKHLRQLGLGRLSALEPPTPVRRYEWARPGELVHLDVKKLARIRRVGHGWTGDRRDSVAGAGWEYLHVAIDDASRLAYAEVLPDEQAATVTAFWTRARGWLARHGLARVRRVLTDNGSAYRSHRFRRLCRGHSIRHYFTRPYTPQTNGKAERFIQTAVREWAYAGAYGSSAGRLATLRPWLRYYNHWRPHRGIGGQPPITRVQSVNNVFDIHS